MLPESARQFFREQHRTFAARVAQEMRRSNPNVSIDISVREPALAFAEQLLFCLSESEAQSRIQQNLEAALAFLHIANALGGEFGNLNTDIAKSWHEQQTRFFVLAAFVQDFLENF